MNLETSPQTMNNRIDFADSGRAPNATADYRLHLTVFLIAFTVRLLFLLFVDGPALFVKYPFFAEKLATGQAIGDRIVDLSPVYLYLTTAFFGIFGESWQLLKCLQALVGSFNCLLTMEIGSRLFDRRTGTFAALILAFYGNAVVLETTLEPMAFVMFFNLTSVLLLVRALKENSAGPPVCGFVGLAGLFAGVSIITKPSFLLFLPLGTLWLALAPAPSIRWQKKLMVVCLFNSLALAAVFPVTVRNYLTLDDLVLVTADAGKVFFHGNSAGATALAWTGLDEEWFADATVDEPDGAHVLFRRKASALSGRSLRPSEASGFWVRRTLSDIAADPVSYVNREFEKIGLFFNGYEMHFIASAYDESRQVLSYPLVRYGMISVLAVLGMVLAAGSWRRFLLLYGTIGIYLISGMIFMVQSRYRLPAVPYMAVFASHAVFCMGALATGRKWISLSVCLLAVGALFAAVKLPFAEEIARMERWQTATKIHYQLRAVPLFRLGRYREAVVELDRCLALVPDLSPALGLRGKSLAVLGESKAALADFHRMIRLTPGIAQGYRDAGFVYLLEGERDAARFHLEKALSISPGDTRTRQALERLK